MSLRKTDGMPPGTGNGKRRTAVFEKGDFLFRQDDTTQDLFILKKGTVRIFKTEGTIEIDLDTVGPGNVVGEIAPIDGGTRSASGVALERCEAILIPSAEFQSVLSSIPEWFRKIALIIVQRLREADARISRSAEGERTNHIAAVISLLAYSEYCTFSSGSYVLDRKSVEHQIMDLLDIPPNEIASALESLRKQSRIQLDRSRIILPRRDALDEMAGKVFTSPS